MRKTSYRLYQSSYILVGDTCAFKIGSDDCIRFGRILQFVKYDKKGKKLGYKGNYANVKHEVGVLCTWYDQQRTRKQTYRMSTSISDYAISNYICTLTQSCFEDNCSSPNSDAIALPFQASSIAMKDEFTISQECLSFISTTKKSTTELRMSSPILVSSSQPPKPTDSKQWISIDKLVLNQVNHG